MKKLWNLRRRARKAEQRRELNCCVAKAREMARTAVIFDEFAEITPEGNKLFDEIGGRLRK